MHEYGVMRNVVRMIEERSAPRGAERVAVVSVRVGALAAADPEHLQAHFFEAARGTIAEGAELRVKVGVDPFDINAQEIVLEGFEVDTLEELQKTRPNSEGFSGDGTPRF